MLKLTCTFVPSEREKVIVFSSEHLQRVWCHSAVKWQWVWAWEWTTSQLSIHGMHYRQSRSIWMIWKEAQLGSELRFLHWLIRPLDFIMQHRSSIHVSIRCYRLWTIRMVLHLAACHDHWGSSVPASPLSRHSSSLYVMRLEPNRCCGYHCLEKVWLKGFICIYATLKPLRIVTPHLPCFLSCPVKHTCFQLAWQYT